MFRFRRRRPRTREEALTEIRAHMRALGWPVDGLTDEQIEESFRKSMEAGAAASRTMAEASERMGRALTAMSHALQQ